MVNVAKLNDDTISKLAYRFWEDEGRPDGRAESHWLRAVAELSVPEIKIAKATKKAKAKR